MITPQRAFAVARQHMVGPFEWGRRDCMTTACAAWAALHGRSPFAGSAPRYATARGAMRILRRAGGYLAWCDAAMGLPRVPVAGCGDLVLVSSAGPMTAALALCIEPGAFATKMETGMAVTASDAMGAWSCPS